jgi:hypothetical protein
MRDFDCNCSTHTEKTANDQFSNDVKISRFLGVTVDHKVRLFITGIIRVNVVQVSATTKLNKPKSRISSDKTFPLF